MIGTNQRAGNLIKNESMNMSNLRNNNSEIQINLTNEYSSLSPNSYGEANHQ